ncbi:MAG: hypothetical protein WBH44_05225 [Proteocatella sp.]
MKRFISIFMILILSAILFAGCSKKNDAKSPVSPEEAASQEAISNKPDSKETLPEETDSDKEKKPVDVSRLMSNKYNELFKSGKYLLKYEGVVDFDPQDIYSTVTIANDGGKSLWIIEAEDSKSHLLTIGNDTSMIDDASKTYMVGTMSNMDSSIINISSLEFVKSEKEVIDDKKMVYEEYKYDIGTLRYYFYKKELYCIVNTNPIESVNMKIIEFSENVTEEMFAIPDGYKEV